MAAEQPQRVTSALTGEQWDLAWQLFQAAADLPPAERRSYLQTASNDRLVIQQVMALLEDSDENPHVPLQRSGTQVSHYQVGERIGRGGMGEVYEAVDLELDRRVAIKFLPQRVLSEERAVQRFLAEAKSASALNHPNLVTIYEFVRENEVLAIVMERIEGRTLRSLLPTASGTPRTVATGEWVRQASQLAEALAAAHAHGIIHRDLKPENIMVREDGYVKILDFGLAVLADRHAPNFSTGTAFSTLAGTPRYMSPEQKANEPLTPASDIYSLGLVFLEMLIGSAQPDHLTELSKRVPRRLVRLLSDMLAERPAQRPTADEVAHRLRQLSPPNSRRVVWFAAASAALLGFAVLAWKVWQPGNTVPQNLVVQPLTSFPGEEYGARFSPDGQRVVFTWDGEQQNNLDLYVMEIRDRKLRRLTTNPASDVHPAWSPDGKTIAFCRFAGLGRVKIYLIPAEGGPERAIGEAKAMERILDWSPDGQWLVVQSGSSMSPGQAGFNLISVRTGETRRLIAAPNGEDYRSPVFSPDGRRIAFIRDLQGVKELAILPLRPDLQPASAPVPLRIADFRAEVCSSPYWTRDGRSLLFVFNRGGVNRLWQVLVPAFSWEVVTPQLVPVGEGVEFPALSADGSRLVFTRIVDDLNLWRIALPVGKRPVAPPHKVMSSTRMERYADVARDGRVAFESDRSGSPEIWVSDDAGGSNARPVTHFGGPVTGSPHWSPDGRSIAFDTRADGQPEIYVVDVPAGAANSGNPRRLTHHPAQDFLPAWSPDGSWIYFSSNRSGITRVWRMPSSGGEPQPVSPGAGRGAAVSPDGQWVYYGRDDQVWRVPAQGGAESLVVKDALPRSFVPTPNGLWFLRWRRSGHSLLQNLNLATGAERTVAELSARIQTGLAISPDESFALISQSDEGTRDLMLVEGYRPPLP